MSRVRWVRPGQGCKHTALGSRRAGAWWRTEADGNWGRPQEGQYQAAMITRKGQAGVSHRRWPGMPCWEVS